MRRSKALVAGAVAVVALAAAAPAGAAPTAEARIVVPRIGLDAPLAVVPDLGRGPGFYRESARPGQGRTIAIAGHRTTHTRPFWALNELQRGDAILVYWQGRRFAYRVSGTRIVRPNDWSIVDERGYERVVLTSCNPRFSARERIVVFALPPEPR
jgi:sortase A